MSEKSSTFAAALRSASWSCTANDIKEGNYIRVDTTTKRSAIEAHRTRLAS